MKRLILSILLTGLVGHLAAQGKDISYSSQGTKLKGYLVSPENKSSKAPGVVVIHAWMGLNDFVKGSATNLAKLGYYAFAADIYGEGVRPQSPAEAGKLSGSYKGDRDLYRSRIQAAIEQLIKAGADPERIAVMGYCFGGTGALEAARANLPVKGVVSFHGGLDKRGDKQENSEISAKVLVLHGADDPFVPESQALAFREEMRSRKADWQMIYYSDAVHAFTEPAAGNNKSSGAAYNEKAAKRSWEDMKKFFQEVFAM
ncbi:dienelactone hydrolase family protein [Arcticibacter sp. MXS-1]|uniref:dienelactone hydrolase family protein n=1 Tax=Arcticibacter sp. MXS-1 TaxID=3341726 RepID=UPI0035A966A2